MLGRARRFAVRRYQRGFARAASATSAGPIGALGAVMSQLPITLEHLLRGYALGMFPAQKRDRITWECPDPRIVIRLDQLRIPPRLARELRSGRLEMRVDRDPVAVLAACGDRPGTWLGQRLQAAYAGLFELGAMHTIEAYQDDVLVGAVFGVSIGGVFAAESMFHTVSDASKLAFAHMAQHVATRGFSLLDCQTTSPTARRFGAIEMPRDEYLDHLARSLARPASFG